MKVINRSRGTVLAGEVNLCFTFADRLRGLLLCRESPPGGCGVLLWKTRRVHTFLMAFPLDIYFLDRRLRVAKVLHRVPPNRIPSPPTGCRHVLELSWREGEEWAAVGDRLSILLELKR